MEMAGNVSSQVANFFPSEPNSIAKTDMMTEEHLDGDLAKETTKQSEIEPNASFLPHQSSPAAIHTIGTPGQAFHGFYGYNPAQFPTPFNPPFNPSFPPFYPQTPYHPGFANGYPMSTGSGSFPQAPTRATPLPHKRSEPASKSHKSGPVQANQLSNTTIAGSLKQRGPWWD